MRLFTNVCVTSAILKCVAKRQAIVKVKFGAGAAELKQLESPEVCRGLSKVIQNWFDDRKVGYIVDGVKRHVGYNRRTRGEYGMWKVSRVSAPIHSASPKARG
jgi:hypothetical protein